MGIPENYLKLREALDDLPAISKKSSSGGLKTSDPRLNQPFSQDELGLKITNAQPGHVEARLKTNESQRNRHNTIHGGALSTAVDAVTAAVAQSNEGKKGGRVELIRDFAIRFHKPVLPGETIEVVSKLDSARESSDESKEIKSIASEIRQGSGDNYRQIGQAISTVIVMDKEDFDASIAA